MMENKKVAVLLANGFEEGEALFVVDIIRRAGFACDSVSCGTAVRESLPQWGQVVLPSMSSKQYMHRFSYAISFTSRLPARMVCI